MQMYRLADVEGDWSCFMIPHPEKSKVFLETCTPRNNNKNDSTSTERFKHYYFGWTELVEIPLDTIDIGNDKK